MKTPLSTFDTDLSTTSWQERSPRQVNISWSPSGKYIFTYAPILWPDDYSDHDFPEDGDGQEQSISFFWDVQNYKPIVMSVDGTSLIEWSSGEEFVDKVTWIDDNLVVGHRSGVHAIAPNSKGTVNINDFGTDSNAVGPRAVYNLAYNEKTFQLAGANHKNIFIWSHYKLPPRLNSRMREDDLGMNDLRLDDSESDEV